ncbi:MAG: peptidoglycan DD-metalloendopeptidase family protein [Candidatus Poribacteria bacterium]|nr:peptidoglycan DD-metalloendopeptidase family protein [Candidatus Poribacteria bacterium]
MTGKSFTVLLTSTGSRRARKFSLSAWQLWGVGLLLACAFGGAVMAASYVFGLYSDTREIQEQNALLLEENAAMSGNYDNMRKELDSIQQVLNDVEQVLGLPMTEGPAVGGGGLPLGGGSMEDGPASTDDIENAEIDTVPEPSKTGLSAPPEEIDGQIVWMFEWADQLRGGLHGLEKMTRSKLDVLKATPSVVPLDMNQGGRYMISSVFGRRVSPITDLYEHHAGIDLATAGGTPVIAAAHGVIRKMHVAPRGSRKGLGNYVVIRHSGSYSTVYGHLNGNKPFADGLKVGSKVKRNQVIGYVGNTGRSTGDHLHYEILRNGVRIDPFPYLINHSDNRRSRR